MTRYDDAFEPWRSLDIEAASERAYALGVQAAVDEVDREELDAVRAEMDSAYARSVVDLAFDEGRTEALAADATEAAAVWDDLVLDGDDLLDTDDERGATDRSTPAALERAKLLDRFDADSRDALDLPSFLQR
jgi:hypothetical protein